MFEYLRTTMAIPFTTNTNSTTRVVIHHANATNNVSNTCSCRRLLSKLATLFGSYIPNLVATCRLINLAWQTGRALGQIMDEYRRLRELIGQIIEVFGGGGNGHRVLPV